MPKAQKRRSLGKTSTENMPMYQPTQKFYCCRCGTSYSRKKGYFPVSHSPMYRGSGHLPICSDCVDAMYEQYREKLGSDRAAMRRMCMKLDLYWSDTIYDMAARAAGVSSRVKTYISKTNLVHYIDKTFDDTIAEEEAEGIDANVKYAPEPITPEQPESLDALAKEEPEPPVDQRLVDFWGAGFTADFYAELERRYKEWTNDTPVLEPSERSLYKQICLLETTISRDSAQGKAIDKNVNVLNTLLGSMNLKPAQKKESIDASMEGTPFGVWIQKWEDTKPVPEPDPELKDVDGIVRYISTWFLGHLCKMLNIKNTYCKLYEDEIAKMKIERPEYEDEDDETVFNNVFDSDSGGDSG